MTMHISQRFFPEAVSSGLITLPEPRPTTAQIRAARSRWITQRSREIAARRAERDVERCRMRELARQWLSRGPQQLGSLKQFCREHSLVYQTFYKFIITERNLRRPTQIISPR